MVVFFGGPDRWIEKFWEKWQPTGLVQKKS
jgi:hypothetical protein